MAYLDCDLYSRALDLHTRVAALLPEKKEDRRGVLFLLHGLSDDSSMWLRQTSLERYVGERGICVIMPEVCRSYYTDMAYGGHYFQYISQELPELAQSLFGLDYRRSTTYAAGNSMGGYGAVKLALCRPDLFCGAASLSGALDVQVSGLADWPQDKSEAKGIFGDDLQVSGTKNDLFALLRQCRSPRGLRPRFFISCGSSDPLLADSRKFTAQAKALSFSVRHREVPGAHGWAVWDKEIPKVLDWML